MSSGTAALSVSIASGMRGSRKRSQRSWKTTFYAFVLHTMYHNFVKISGRIG
jgi:hypothetical protein